MQIVENPLQGRLLPLQSRFFNIHYIILICPSFCNPEKPESVQNGDGYLFVYCISYEAMCYFMKELCKGGFCLEKQEKALLFKTLPDENRICVPEAVAKRQARQSKELETASYPTAWGRFDIGRFLDKAEGLWYNKTWSLS